MGKKYRLAFFLILALMVPNGSYAEGEQFDITRSDHQGHVISSAAITVLGGVVFKQTGMDPGWAMVSAGLLTFALGATKELLIDDEYSSGDQMANGIGVISGVTIGIAFAF